MEVIGRVKSGTETQNDSGDKKKGTDLLFYALIYAQCLTNLVSGLGSSFAPATATLIRPCMSS